MHIRQYSLIAFSGIGTLFFANCEAPPTSITSQQSEVRSEPTNVPAMSLDSADSLKLRLLESYALYWPLISSEYQHEQLPQVLQDPIPELRAFGIDRVAVLLRDGDATDEELQLVVDHLRDTSPMVRLAAAQLLPEINVPGLAEFVANSLAVEKDTHVIEEELSFFRTRPDPKAIEPTIALLSTAKNDDSANTLIVLLDATEISDQTKLRIVKTVQRARSRNNSTSLITLEAMLGNQFVQRQLVPLLEHPNKDIRDAVAKGFASSGFSDPLIERALQYDLYEYALIALQKKADIESFKQLMALYVHENENWKTSAFDIAVSLDTSALLRADDMLKRIELNDLRLAILSAVWENAIDKIPAERKAIARRTVPLMITSGNAVGALQLFDIFGESLVDEDLLSLRFRAAISAAAWDAAADARSIPEPWILAWLSVRDSDPTTSAVIKQQIMQRFQDQLTAEQQKILGIVQVQAKPDSEE